MKHKFGLGLLLAPLLLTGCQGILDIFRETIVGTGEIVTVEHEDRDYEKYTTLNVKDLRVLSSRASLKVYSSTEEHKIIVKAQENIEKKINVNYSGSTITVAGNESEEYKTESIEIEVYGYTFSKVFVSTVRAWLYEGTISETKAFLDFSTNSYAEAYNLKTNDLELRSSGSSTAYIPITAPTMTSLKCSISGGSSLIVKAKDTSIDNTKLNISGGSSVAMNGNTTTLDANLSGGSQFVGENFVADNIEATLSGGSRLSSQVNNKLVAELSGGSALTYYTSNVDLDITKSLSGGSIIIKGKLPEDN
ncbi:MAG: DUF2807 domain-containing protein [Gammaproteobacteria bacterium]|nr:DUF2807 domain-containing protein [Gammaproteobacteria bacterium]